MNRFFLLFFLFASACYRVPDTLDPKVNLPLLEQHFAHLSSAFAPLSVVEKNSDWGREYIIARAFASELDLYRAISTFKRSLILLPKEENERKLEMQYDIVLCFFLGKRYEEAIEAFDKSELSHVDKTFPAYHDLLLVLYECYRELCDGEKQQRIYELLEQSYPETAEKIRLSRAIREGNLEEIESFASGFQSDSYLDSFLAAYKAEKKSIATAQTLNLLLPGAGYLYIGQKKSALTAFLLNGLFITASVQFFRHRHIAAGIITAGFETGWYFGGVYGAGEEAKYYNERLYEKYASAILNEHKLFPVLMMQYEF